MRYLSVLILLFIVGCGANFTYKSAVSLNGTESIEQKIKIADETVRSLWDGDLKEKLRNEFSELKNAAIEKHLGLTYTKTTFTSFDKSKEPRDIVAIICFFKSPDGRLNKKIAESCIAKVKLLLDRNGVKYEM